MIIVPEKEIADLVTAADAYAAVEQVFVAMAERNAFNLPVIREAIGHADALFGVKAGFDRARLNLGLKSGGYWPLNAKRSLANHQSTILLFDANSGKCRAVVGANLLTALRTAAAAAVSITHLARKDARVLGLVGAGHQSVFQLAAVARRWPFTKILAWNRTPAKLEKLARAAADLNLSFHAASLEELGAEADVIVTITSSFAPILLDRHVRPGTHLACMGTDTRGKQEVETALVRRASLFADEIAQSATIGECQHAISDGTVTEPSITELGSVINGDHPGRRSEDEITLFDGTGVALQDLAVAAVAVERATTRGSAVVVDF